MAETYARNVWPLKDARAVRSREALRNSFLELLENRPLDQITIREITGAAGVGYTTFFRHYSAKEEILDEIAAEQIRRLVDLAVPILDSADTRQSCLALCSYVEEHRPLWTTLLTGGAADTVRTEFIRIAEEVAAERGTSSEWLPMEVAVLLASSVTIELLAWWLRQSHPFPARRVAEILDRVIIGPMVQGKL